MISGFVDFPQCFLLDIENNSSGLKTIGLTFRHVFLPTDVNPTSNSLGWFLVETMLLSVIYNPLRLDTMVISAV